VVGAQYLDHVRSRLFPMNEQDRFESPYYDYLQAPLQPLMDNLESQTVGRPRPSCRTALCGHGVCDVMCVVVAV
jgi:hypothetical protein